MRVEPIFEVVGSGEPSDTELELLAAILLAADDDKTTDQPADETSREVA